MSRPAAKFLSELEFRDISQGEDILTIQLTRPFSVYSAELEDIVEVPAGFICDGESIPRMLHSFVPPFGASRRGAVVHDWLYKNAGYRTSGGLFIAVSRLLSDKVYRELLLLRGLAWWRAQNRYLQLRTYGWYAWNKHRNSDVSAADVVPFT